MSSSLRYGALIYDGIRQIIIPNADQASLPIHLFFRQINGMPVSMLGFTFSEQLLPLPQATSDISKLQHPCQPPMLWPEHQIKLPWWVRQKWRWRKTHTTTFVSNLITLPIYVRAHITSKQNVQQQATAYTSVAVWQKCYLLSPYGCVSVLSKWLYRWRQRNRIHGSREPLSPHTLPNFTHANSK